MVRIEWPFHGAVLNGRHGEKTDEGLKITVRGRGPVGRDVTVNGVPARRNGERFEADIVLTERENDIVAAARDVTGRAEHGVRVVWDRNSRPRYRFSIDDNSFFVRDLAGTRPKSLFDCFYLAILRDLNRRYGAKFVLNMFYATPEDDFDLSQFPDTYRGEWADNADWLKLSFHARAEFPNRPYEYAAPEKLAEDFDLVAGEILRFAGEETWSPPTVIHWGMVQPMALPVLIERGVRVLSGLPRRYPGGNYTTDDEKRRAMAAARYDVNYLLDERRSEYLAHHDALMDFESGICFSRGDIVCNNTPLDRVVPTLEPLTRDPDNAEIMDLFTHEQYFWPFYSHHRPDHAERLDAAIRFCTEQGYEPVWFHEGFLGVEP